MVSDPEQVYFFLNKIPNTSQEDVLEASDTIITTQTSSACHP